MAQRALGTIIKLGANTIGGVKSIGGVSISAETLDTTLLTDEYKQKIQGVKDTDDITVSGFFTPSDTNGQVAVFALLDSGAVSAFSIVFPPALGASWDFNAIVTGFSTGETASDGTVDFEITLAVTGKPTLNMTASTGLTDLAVSDGTLTPEFSATKYEYNLTVTETSISVTPTAAGSTITVNGAVVASESASGAIAIAAGTITQIVITVSQSGKTPKTYKINAYRAA